MNSNTLLNRGFFQSISNLLEPTTIRSGRYRGLFSNTSKSIKNKGDVSLTIVNAFNLGDSDIEAFNRGFNMAIDGDGDEANKILTIHSSSLLALLCFFSISETNPLKIGDDVYSEVLFEVKNIVIKKDRRKPSNVDVVLVSKSGVGKIKKLLLLESKFTEYINHRRRVELAEKYRPFYEFFVKHFPEYTVHHRNESTSTKFGLISDDPHYLGGIKQAFSHLLGIATRPADDANVYRKKYKEYFEQAKALEFATILHDWNREEFDKYQSIYKSTFENIEIIKEGLKQFAPNTEAVDLLFINPIIYTYKDVFKDFELPGIIREAYRL